MLVIVLVNYFLPEIHQKTALGLFLSDFILDTFFFFFFSPHEKSLKTSQFKIQETIKKIGKKGLISDVFLVRNSEKWPNLPYPSLTISS